MLAILFRRPIENTIAEYSLVLSLGWKEGVVVTLVGSALLLLVNMRDGWRVFFLIYFATVLLYLTSATDWAAAVYRLAYYLSGPVVFLILASSIRTWRGAEIALNYIAFCLGVYISLSALSLLIDETTLREFFGMTLQLAGEECDDRACMRTKEIFGEVVVQRGGLLFDQFATGFLAVALVPMLNRVSQSLLRRVLLLAALLVLFFTYARSAYLALAIFLALVFARTFDKRSGVVLLVFIVVIALSVVGAEVAIDALALTDTNVEYRIDTYLQYIPALISEFPLGRGFELEAATYLPDLGASGSTTAGESFVGAILVSMGLPGLFTYLGLAIAVCGHCMQVQAHSEGSSAHTLYRALALFISFHIACLGLPTLFSRDVNIFMWGYLAAALSLAEQSLALKPSNTSR